MPQLIHLQWFYELAEKPPGSSKVYITQAKSQHCFSFCYIAQTQGFVLSICTAGSSLPSQYDWFPELRCQPLKLFHNIRVLTKGVFAYDPLTSSLFLSTKGQSFCSPPLAQERREEQERMKSIYQIFQICTNEGQHMEDPMSQTPAPKEKCFKTVSGTTSSIRPVSSPFVLMKTSAPLLRAANVPFAPTEVRLQVCCWNYGLHNTAPSSLTEMLESGIHPPCSQTPPDFS